MLRDTMAVAAIISPIPDEIEKNWMAKAKPIAAIIPGSPSCEIQNRLAASTRKTKVIPIAPVIVSTYPIRHPGFLAIASGGKRRRSLKKLCSPLEKSSTGRTE